MCGYLKQQRSRAGNKCRNHTKVIMQDLSLSTDAYRKDRTTCSKKANLSHVASKKMNEQYEPAYSLTTAKENSVDLVAIVKGIDDSSINATNVLA